MEETPAWAFEVAIPALLRAARTRYGAAIRVAFLAHGYEDMPRNGAFVLGAIVRTGAPLGNIIKSLGVSKQTAGQLVDTLVARGYLVRAVDPDDRRRLTVSLTERGAGAAEVSRQAVDAVDAALTRAVGEDCVAQMRRGLAALIDQGTEEGED